MTARKPRADAERNRLLLVEQAKATFAEKGSAASLDEIARAAGVGIGTLYRHFPTRDALVSAVYRKESDQLAAAAPRLAGTLDPVAALRAWMLLFVDYLATKRGMAEVLNSLTDGPSGLYAESSHGMLTALGMLVDRASTSGDLRSDIDPADLLRAVGGVAYLSPAPDWQETARRMVDILIAGLRKAD